MKKGTCLIIITSLSVCTIHAQGILGRLEKKAKEKVNQRIEEKAGEKMDEELDQVFKSDQKSQPDSSKGNARSNDSAQNANFAKLLMGNRFSACTAKKQYSYTSKATIDMYSVGKKKKDSFSMRYYWYMTSSYENMAMEIIPFSESMQAAKGTKTIIDLKDSCIVTLMNQNGNKMMMTMKYGETDYGAYVDTSTIQRPVKTGNTKTINGKRCSEYILDNKETYQQMWIESSKTVIWDQNLKNWKAASSPLKNSAEMGQFFDFYPLETVTKDKKSGTITTMLLRSMVKQDITIGTTGYTQF